MDFHSAWHWLTATVARVLRGLVVVLVVVIMLALVGACAHSYLTLSASPPRVQAISPSITNDTSALFGAGADLARGNLLGAAERIIDGVYFDIEIEIINRGFSPVYLGTSEHTLMLNSVEMTETIKLKGVWIGPNSTSTIPMRVTFHLSDLPGAVVLGIVQGGLIEVHLRSQVGWGPLSNSVETEITRFSVIETVESKVRGLLPN